MGKSLEEVHESISTQGKTTRFRKILAFFGPAYLISVGYMDPGNWATDLWRKSVWLFATLGFINE
jgi:manganese transport protein